MQKPEIGLSKENLKKITEILQGILASGSVLYIKTRKYHWNVAGSSFMELHKLFESQYDRLAEAVDEVAEWISKYGELAIGTTTEFAKHSIIKETPGKNPDTKGKLEELKSDHETIIQAIRKYIDEVEEKYNDKGTADFLTALMKSHETMAWELRRYLD